MAYNNIAKENKMTIPVFQKEIDSGIAEQIKNDNTVAFIASCRLNKKLEEIIKATADLADYIGDFDLYPFESVLCSTGRNENDDIFLKEELWKAKNTAIGKKINFMHNETDIIGHMVATRALDIEGNSLSYLLPEEDVPNQFDLVSCGLLYKIWDDPKLQERMDSLIAEMENGNWYVSMECLFPTFDYGIISAAGQQYVIPRNEETSMLSKYLKRYGGSGKYENYSIGRVLRNLTFSGKGIVDNPANKRSVILNTVSQFMGTAASLDIFHDTEINIMDPVLTVSKEKYETLADEVKNLKAEAKVAAEKAVEAQVNSAKARVTQLESELSASKEVTKANEDKVKTLEADVKTLTEKLTKANTDLAVVAKDNLKAKRLAMFAEVDILPAKAEELVNKFIDASEDMFNELVTAMPKKTVATPVPTPVVTPTVTAEAALANATVEQTVKTIPTVDATKDTRAKASTWLGSILKTSVKENK